MAALTVYLAIFMDIFASEKKICIIGSGLVGALLATLLAEAGFGVDVYEKRNDPRKMNGGEGRTIALSLSDRGWKALRYAGLEKTIRLNTNPAYGRRIHTGNGEDQIQKYGSGSEAIHTVNRSYLNTVLIERALETKKVNFFFSYVCEDIKQDTGEIIFTINGTGEKLSRKYDHIFGADGMFSVVRKSFTDKNLFKFDESKLEVGYKEMRIPADRNGNSVLEKNLVHVWPRKNSMFISFPTKAGEFVSTLFMPVAGEDSLESISDPAALKNFLTREYPEIIKLVPDFEEQFFKNPSSQLFQVKGGPWHYKDKILLIGDSCHAITPFYGMGMNIGFEDCTVLLDLLRKNSFNFEKVFAEFGTLRKPDTDAMTELSLNNLKSINESPDPDYQTKWLIERRIWELFPKLWTPAYVLIAFSHVALSKVAQIKKQQDGIVNELVVKYPSILDFTDKELKMVFKPVFAGFNRTIRPFSFKSFFRASVS